VHKNREAVKYNNNKKVDQGEPSCVWLADGLKRQFVTANTLGFQGIVEFKISNAN
jgi:hypothetical protein